MSNDTLLWECAECGDRFESDPTDHHSMDSCDCGEAWVDHETYQLRRNADAIQVAGDDA